ncbi:pullulanase-associated domain-containing protein [Haliovirga abyssi]|uniref:pullulanase n=1 Tax=Haliovirga abyssi TaxID=2996794 RepID=A0AAU9D7A0_9FUSO|nr:pullulanase-associated domain-containing protein [Haliovirga abyssi]BDU49446.1 hypothetical protein HLVA_00150 [Haliovirga abyssi]
MKKNILLLFIVVFSLFGCIEKSNNVEKETKTDTTNLTGNTIRVHYSGDNSWGLHLWGASIKTEKDGVFYIGNTKHDWTTPLNFDKSDSFGVYVDFKILDSSQDLNFIIHKGDVKDSADRDDKNPRKLDVSNGNREFWVIKNESTIYTKLPTITQKIERAEIVNDKTLKCYITLNEDIKLSEIKAYKRDGKEEIITNVLRDGKILTLTLNNASKIVKLEYKENYFYTTISSEALRGDIFYYSGDDLGAKLNSDGTVDLKVWSPLAMEISVNIYDKTDQNKKVAGAIKLNLGDAGVWSVKLNKANTTLDNMDGYFYQYEVKAYYPQEKAVKTKQALDPYAKSMASFDSNSNDKIGKGAFVDINSINAGEKSSSIGNTNLENSVEEIAYETHVRDFTISAEDVPENERGTFKGFSDFTKGLTHLKNLGITDVQFLPVQNYYTVNEKEKSYMPVGNGDKTNYNWGYDPHNYFTVEGWLSSDSEDPYNRIKEYRELVGKLHENGIGVIMDVVYNHTYGWDVFENIAPGCYYRTIEGTISTKSGAGPTVESRNKMVRKLIIDSLKHFVNEYGVDGFRFDLMGFIDTDTMKEIRKEVGDKIILQGEAWNFTDLDKGESPIKGETASYPHNIDLAVFNDTSRDSYSGSTSAEGDNGFVQGNIKLTGKVKAGIIGGITGFDNGGTPLNITENGYDLFADSPKETLNYQSIHDGFTLWDKINLNIKGTKEIRAKYVKQAMAMLFTSEGKIIIQGGDEIGRTKPLALDDANGSNRAHTNSNYDSDGEPDSSGGKLHENSYKSPDYTNMFRWDRMDKEPYASLDEYVQGLVKMRKSIPAFRYENSESIKNGLKFIGEEGFNSGETTGPFSNFSELQDLTLKFINGVPDSVYYVVGEVFSTAGDGGVNGNPATNAFKIVFDSEGKGEITFTKGQISEFNLSGWSDPNNLQVKLVKTPGKWDFVPGGYSGSGNNSIKIGTISNSREVQIDLGVEDDIPGQVPFENNNYIAYELDNSLESGGDTNYTKIIVVHNVGSVTEKISVPEIVNNSNWKVIVDEDDAGILPLDYNENGGRGKTNVKILNGEIDVPANSTSVIAK